MVLAVPEAQVEVRLQQAAAVGRELELVELPAAERVAVALAVEVGMVWLQAADTEGPAEASADIHPAWAADNP